MQKKILGLDLGVTSIGWALISENDDTQKSIIDMGVRIVPLSTNDKDEFSTGNAISKNQNRTMKRTQRKGYDRYQLRRYALVQLLTKAGIMPDETLFKLSSVELYELRDKSLREKIELKEIGRIFYHLNQRRGYKSSRGDASADKKDTEYVAAVKARHTQLKESGVTIGQYFYEQLKENKFYRIKEQVFPREAYEEEFDAICSSQQQYHEELTDDLIDKFKNDIIYYQRKLKSQKGLVSICELESKEKQDNKGNMILCGPKVAPKSSPLFQLCKIWESINNISLKVKNPEPGKYKWSDYILTIDEKKQIAEHLSTKALLSYADLLNILKLRKENVYANKQIQKGIQGNITYSEISKIIPGNTLLCLNVDITHTNGKAILVDKKSGEILDEQESLIVNSNIEQEPFYQLWHTIYSIKDLDECKNALIKRFNLKEEDADKLSKIDFNKAAFGDKSNKAMRKILPYLMKGYNYSEACSFAGYNHSNSQTKEELANLQTEDNLKLLSKNSLRQPVVEKILNQMINLVNALILKYGKPDEIRVELARELKQSKIERNEADKLNSLNKKLNDEIAKRLTSLGVPATKRYIQKYKFIFPTREKKWNEAQTVNQCIYCGESFNLAEALTGDNFDVDHIVPQSMLFDDSQTNKVLVHRKCNKDKTNLTAYDYIAAKGEAALHDYLERVDDWFKRGIISYSKMQRLKVSYIEYSERKKHKKETEADKKLWESFVDRQLRQTSYIARKARQILQRVCRYVNTTEGTVTAKLREIWGWDDVLMNLQLPGYKAIGQTEIKEWTSDHGKRIHQKEVIAGWTKRNDHRHHAIDALVAACTQQGFIQRINTLNASEIRSEMLTEVEDAHIKFTEKLSLLEQYLLSKKPFLTKQVEDAAAQILISFKPGKKVATTSKLKAKGKNIEKGVITPRGALSEESIYGKIKVTEKNKPVKYLFENPHLIFKPYIKELVEERIAMHKGDTKKAIASLKKDPIYLDEQKAKLLEYGSCFKEEVVIKYPVENIKAKDIDFIIDKKVKQIIKERIALLGEKEAFKELDKRPVWYNEEHKIPIRTVRFFTGLSAVEPVKKDANGKDIGFVKPGNNHHIAFYIDENGKMQEHVCSFWHAVERKKFGFPVIVQDTKTLWDKILQNPEDYPESFLSKLPSDKWTFEQSMQQNEMFIIGMSKEDCEIAINTNNRPLLSDHLYRVQSVANSEYWLRHHLETELINNSETKIAKRYFRFKSVGAFMNTTPIKMKITNTGEINIVK